MLVTSAPGRLTNTEDHREFKGSLGYIERPRLKVSNHSNKCPQCSPLWEPQNCIGFLWIPLTTFIRLVWFRQEAWPQRAWYPLSKVNLSSQQVQELRRGFQPLQPAPSAPCVGKHSFLTIAHTVLLPHCTNATTENRISSTVARGSALHCRAEGAFRVGSNRG